MEQENTQYGIRKINVLFKISVYRKKYPVYISNNPVLRINFWLRIKIVSEYVRGVFKSF